VTGFSETGSRAFSPQTFAARSTPGERLVHFIKLHGSVSWKLQRRLGRQTVVETAGSTAPTGEHDCVLYFGYKSVPEEEPFKTLHNQLKQSLLLPRAMIVIGFQFADPYIRETFDFALRANKSLRLICYLRRSPEPSTPLKNLLEDFPEQISVLRGRDKVGLSPWLRQTVKTLFAVGWNCMVPRRRFLQAACQLVKRRQALRERNRPRNSQPETHPFDERGRGPERLRPHRRDRLRHASENS
jgi:hypothetical protein